MSLLEVLGNCSGLPAAHREQQFVRARFCELSNDVRWAPTGCGTSRDFDMDAYPRQEPLELDEFLIREPMLR